jgi:tRNA 2-thiocytidine biosynthesis protein TtcA
MPPKLLTDDARHVVIRPLAYCGEDEIARYARGMGFPIVPCTLCGSQNNLQRQKVREMMAEWDARYPGRTESVFSAMQNVVLSHLADNALFDFRGLDSMLTETDSEAFDATEAPVYAAPIGFLKKDAHLETL